MSIVFLKFPEKYDSVCGELIYQVGDVESGAIIDVKVLQSGVVTPIGVKRFKSSGVIDVNVASYARRCISPSPLIVEKMTFGQDKGRTISISIGCRGVATQQRMFTCASRKLLDYEHLTSLPLRRSISWNELDEISILAPENAALSFAIKLSGGATFEYNSERLQLPEGIISLPVVMHDIAKKASAAGFNKNQFDSLRVTVSKGIEVLAEVNYDIRQRNDGEFRLCWLNQMGGIDYHTFKSSISEKQMVQKDEIENRGSIRSYAANLERRKVLTSGYVPSSLGQGLAKIFSSPLVWLIVDEECVAVDVLPSSVEITERKANLLTFEIRDIVKDKLQKF